MTTQDEMMRQRDLSFHPARVQNPHRLTSEQAEFYNEQGYIKGLPIYDEASALENRRYFDDLLAKVTAANDGRDSYSINGYHTQCAGIWDMVVNPLILDYVEDILGPNFICWGTHFFCKMPGDGKAVSWHQDASYWPLTPSKTVTAWLAIDDSDLENGCMQVIPGTHRMGHLEFRPSAPEENNVLNQTVVNADELGKPVPFELKAGQISLHSDLLVHGSEPNHSQRRRSGLTMRYASVDVKALSPMWSQAAILCRGKDPESNWANVPRPEGESVELLSWQKPAPPAGG